MYRVIVPFVDLKDILFEYKVGDKFPRSGLKVGPKRYAELAGPDNKRGVPLIVKVEK